MLKTELRASLGKSILFLLLVSILAVGCQTADLSESSSANPGKISAVELTPGLVEAGVGIKEVKLGQSKAEVEQSLGAPSETDRNEYVEGQTYLLFHPKGIELTLQDDKVEMITLHAKTGNWSPYTGATPEGVGVGSTSKEVVEALGTADEDAPRSLKYGKKGLWFRFDQNREGDGSNTRAESLSIVPGEL